MQNPAYFLRFLDILRSSEGEPLLEQLLKSEDKLAALLPPPPAGAQLWMQPGDCSGLNLPSPHHMMTARTHVLKGKLNGEAHWLSTIAPWLPVRAAPS
jgi:hypothetical protein